jgi:hypothetical protein
VRFDARAISSTPDEDGRACEPLPVKYSAKLSCFSSSSAIRSNAVLGVVPQ